MSQPKAPLTTTTSSCPPASPRTHGCRPRKLRPGNRQLVHHVIAFIRPPGSKWLKDGPIGEAFVPKRGARSRQNADAAAGTKPPPWPVRNCWSAMHRDFRNRSSFPDKRGWFLRDPTSCSSCTTRPTESPATDQTKVGIVYCQGGAEAARGDPHRNTGALRHPARRPELRSEIRTSQLQDDSIAGLADAAHAPARQGFQYKPCIRPAKSRVLLKVPKYDFNWQLAYETQKPLLLPKGTRIECVAHFDNSPNNKYNPDPSKEVRWGDQSWEEMMIGWFGVAIDAKADPMTFVCRRQGFQEARVQEQRLDVQMRDGPRRPSRPQQTMKTILLGVSLAAALLAAAPPTFTKDVLPILQENCQGCHRAGEIGPMAFMNYEQVRPWAKAIKADVIARKMPPWFADPHYGKFANDRSLTEAELKTLVAWVDGGAKQGDPKAAPPPREWLEGWNINKPDMVIELPVEMKIPAKGTVDYQYILTPTTFKEDVWVQMVEVRSASPSVVHHAVVFIREPESKWLRNEIEPGKPWDRSAAAAQRGDLRRR